MAVVARTQTDWMKAVEEVTRRIVNTVRPQRILLFGSAARGNFNRDSDLDFLVIMRSPVHRRQVAQQIYRNLHGVDLPVDIIVATEEDMTQHGDKSWSILRPALAEGQIIYDEQH